MSFVPIKQFLDTLFYFHFMRPAKAVEFGNINEFTHSTIRLASIKGYLALKAFPIGSIPSKSFISRTLMGMNAYRFLLINSILSKVIVL